MIKTFGRFTQRHGGGLGVQICRCGSDLGRRSVPQPQNEQQRRLREEFWRREDVHGAGVDLARLSAEEKLIHLTHNEAVKNQHFTYDDPQTGLKVITRLRHFLKGSCCGNACRHCVYEHQIVDKDRREKRKFNTAFWIDKPEEEGMEGEKLWSVSEQELQEYLRVLLVLVRECGDIISSAISSQANVEIDLKVENKEEGNSSSVLTQTDIKVEKHLIAGLRGKFPDHKFIGEESSSETEELGNAPTWIIDPIDGTMNFIHSNPLVCTSVGLTVNRKLVLGVVNCPLIGKLYSATKEGGAFCNGDKIRVSGVVEMSQAMMIMELPVGASKQKKDVGMDNVRYILDNAHALRAPGPAALDISWVGAGAADGYFSQSIHSWDMAAGALIVQEAGGSVLDTTGGDFDLMSRGIVVASSAKLAREICSFIKLLPTPRDQQTPVHPL